MMHRVHLLFVTTALAGCASAGKPAREPSALGSTPVKWAGTFQPQQQRSAALGPTQKNIAYGTVSITPTDSDDERSQVQINLNAGVTSGQTLAWGIYPGRCGSGSGLAMPLVTQTNLPPIEVIRSGGAQLNSEVKLKMPRSGSYQVNIFWTQRASADLADVMTCANIVPQSR